MKKIISFLLIVVTIIYTSALTPMRVSAKVSINKFKSSGYGSSFMYVNKKYIFPGKNYFLIKNSLIGKGKKIKCKKLAGNYISDGKTIYFTVQEGTSGTDIGHRSYSIYSVKTNGQLLKKVTTGVIELDLVTYYKNCLYYIDAENPDNATFPYRLMKFNMKTKDKKCISGKYLAARCVYHNGKIYFSNALLSVEEINSKPCYSVDLKTEKIKKVKDSTTAFDECSSSKYLCMKSFKWDLKKDISKKMYIYIINNNNKITKSKKIPNNKTIVYVSRNAKYAIYRDSKERYYKFNLKNGKKTKLSGAKKLYYNVIEDEKSSKVYFVDDTNKKLTVKKLIGNKLKSVKISGKSSVKLSGKYGNSFNIVGEYIIVTNYLKYSFYKLKT